jgi:hypothetical protein
MATVVVAEEDVKLEQARSGSVVVVDLEQFWVGL